MTQKTMLEHTLLGKTAFLSWFKTFFGASHPCKVFISHYHHTTNLSYSTLIPIEVVCPRKVRHCITCWAKNPHYT